MARKKELAKKYFGGVRPAQGRKPVLAWTGRRFPKSQKCEKNLFLRAVQAGRKFGKFSRKPSGEPRLKSFLAGTEGQVWVHIGASNLMINRRNFIAASAALGGGLSWGLLPPSAKAAESKDRKRPKLAISTYSYWHFKTAKVPIETVIDKSAAIGVQGVDILHRQMNIVEKDPLDDAGRSYLRKLKRHAFLNGIDLICLSTHQTFVTPKPEELTANVEHTKKCIEIAYELGIPCMRINTGRWNTVDFDTLMAQRGIEKPLQG